MNFFEFEKNFTHPEWHKTSSPKFLFFFLKFIMVKGEGLHMIGNSWDIFRIRIFMSIFKTLEPEEKQQIKRFVDFHRYRCVRLIELVNQDFKFENEAKWHLFKFI